MNIETERPHLLPPMVRKHLSDLAVLLISVIPALPIALLTLSATADGWHRYPLTSVGIYTDEYFATLPGTPIIARIVAIGGNPFLLWSALSFFNYVLVSSATLILLRGQPFAARAVGTFTSVACYLLLNIESPRGWNHASLAFFWFGACLIIVALERTSAPQPNSKPSIPKTSRYLLGVAGFFLAVAVLVKHSQAIPVAILLAFSSAWHAFRTPTRCFALAIVRPLALGATPPLLLSTTWALAHGRLSEVSRSVFSVAGKEQSSEVWLKVFASELFAAPSQRGLVPTFFLALCILGSLLLKRFPETVPPIRVLISVGLAFSVLVFLTFDPTWPSFVVSGSAFGAGIISLLKSRVRHEQSVLLLSCVLAILFAISASGSGSFVNIIPTAARTTGMGAAFGAVVVFVTLLVRWVLRQNVPIAALFLTAATLSQVFIVARSGVMHGAVFAPVIGFALGSLARCHKGLLLPLVAATSLGITASARYAEPMTWWGFREPSITTDVRLVDFEHGGKILLTGENASYWMRADRVLSSLPRNNSDRIFSYPVNPIFVTLSGISPVDVPCPVVWFDLCPEQLKRETLDTLMDKPPRYLVWSPAGPDAFVAHEYNFNRGKPSVLREFESWFDTQMKNGKYKYVAMLPGVTAASYDWRVYSRTD